MFLIYPTLSDQKGYKCPDCGCELSQPHDLFFQGMHVLADISCTCCEIDYFQTFPVGHGALYPVSFTKDYRKVKYNPKVKAWRADPLLQSMWDAKQSFRPEVVVTIRKNVGKAILLNALDTCYGHVFQKILNIQWHMDHHTEYAIILLVPEGFEWMVPEEVAEIWTVKCGLKELDKKIEGFDTWIKSQYSRFAELAISKAHIQPDASTIDWSTFLKHPRFDLKEFSKVPFNITCVWREDRFWHTYGWEETLYLASRKFNFFPYFKWFFVWRQMGNIRSLTKKVLKADKKAHFYLVGLGTDGKVPVGVEDKRLPGPYTKGEEALWIPLLSKSHVVVGVLGSHMLLPTALAAGFVDLVPPRMMDALGEDIAQPYTNRLSHFLGRFLVGHSTPSTVAKQVLSIVQGFSGYERLLK